MKYKDGDKVNVLIDEEIMSYCLEGCTEDCIIRMNRYEAFTVKEENKCYRLYFEDKSSMCLLLEKYLKPARKWIRMK